jgi:hypothetical protein
MTLSGSDYPLRRVLRPPVLAYQTREVGGPRVTSTSLGLGLGLEAWMLRGIGRPCSTSCARRHRPYNERSACFTLVGMQPYTERSANPEDQPATNVHSNVEDIVGANVRMTVQEAAAALGITVEAVRGRMHRGKYGREKTDDGRVFVVLTPDQLMNGRERLSSPQANVSDESTESNDERSPNQSPHVRNQSVANGPLVEELRDHLAFLRAELEARNEEIRRREEEHREEARRKDTIIAQLTQRIPELPSVSSPEPRDAPETGSDEANREEVPLQTQEHKERRSWLHRFFGFE